VPCLRVSWCGNDPGSFLSAGVCAWRAHGDEVASVGDLGDQVVVKVGEVSGGKTPRRH